MINISLIGRVGKDPEMRCAPSGESFVTFSLAISSGTKAKPKTIWIECTVNGARAEIIKTYVTKGMQLYCSGKPSVNAYKNKAGEAVGSLQVLINEFEFIGGKSEDKQSATADFNAPAPSLDSDVCPF